MGARVVGLCDHIGPGQSSIDRFPYRVHRLCGVEGKEGEPEQVQG